MFFGLLAPSGFVPIGTFTVRAKFGLAFPFGWPFMAATLTDPVPNNLFYLAHARHIIVNNILCQLTYLT